MHATNIETRMTLSEAAVRLGRSASRVQQLHAAGRLPAERTPRGMRLFRASDIDRLRRELDSRKQEAPGAV